MRTEVDFWVIVDRHIDFLLRLSRPAVVRWRVVARDYLHRLLNKLVALILELLAVAVLARVHTLAEVVVLRWRGRRAALLLVHLRTLQKVPCVSSPISVRRYHIVDPQLLTNLLNTQVRYVGIELLSSHGRGDGRGQIHQARRLVLRRVAPSVVLAPLLGAIGIQLWLSTVRAATTLVVERGRGRTICLRGRIVITTEAATIPERDGVSTGLSDVAPPRHGVVQSIGD